MGAAVLSALFLVGVGVFGWSALRDTRAVIEVAPAFVRHLVAGRDRDAAALLTPERRGKLAAGELRAVAEREVKPLGTVESVKIRPERSAGVAVVVVGSAGSAVCRLTLASTGEGPRIADYRFERE